MANLRVMRPRVQMVLALLMLADLGLAVYLVSPWRARPQQLQEELRSASTQLKLRRLQVGPLMGMDQKLDHSRSDLAKFYQERLASEDSMIAIELGKLAGANGVQIAGVKYKEKDAPVEGLRQVNLEAELEGDYLNEVKFINALERDKVLFILDGVGLDEQQAGTVRLNLQMETFLKPR